jgi:hypothetical protein
MESYLISLFFNVIDYIPPLAKKFLPLIKLYPRNILFVESEWEQKSTFFVLNRSDKILFDVYIKIDVGSFKGSDFKIEKLGNTNSEFNEKVGEIFTNLEMVLFKCVFQSGIEFIVIKIMQINPKSQLKFSITVNKNVNVLLKLLKYSKTPSKILTQDNKLSVIFEIPLKNTNEKFSIKSASFLMNK